MSEDEGEFKKRLLKRFLQGGDGWDTAGQKNGKPCYESEILDWIDEAAKEYPQVSQKWLPTKGKRIDWKKTCEIMEQKIIEFENFGKEWFGVAKKEVAE